MATHRKRAVRPALGPRTTSGSRAAPRGIKAPRDTTPADTDPSMAQSFLPFCAHCEQQIIVPNTSILYCSEKCRRKDQAKPPPLPIGGSSLPSCNPYNLTPPLTPGYAHDIPEPPLKNYVEPFSPTPPRATIPLDDYHPGAQPISIGGHTRSKSSYSPPNESLPPSPNNSNIYMPPRRPGHVRTLTGGPVPTVSTLSSQNGYSTNNAYYQRPLPPLHKPHPYSSSPRSIELVTPFLPPTPAPTPKPTAHPAPGQAELVYKKRSTLPSAGMTGQGGSLKTLFNFDAIRGRPISTPTPTPNSSYISRMNTASPSEERGMGFPSATPILTFR